jgi:hypothetical protein
MTDMTLIKLNAGWMKREIITNEPELTPIQVRDGEGQFVLSLASSASLRMTKSEPLGMLENVMTSLFRPSRCQVIDGSSIFASAATFFVAPGAPAA